MITPNFKKFKIEAYKPGKSKVKKLKNVIKLSANESALGMSPKAKKIISNKNLNLDKYPDGKSKNLRKAISKAYKCNSEKIICGAGSDEVIQMLCQLFLNPKDEVVVPEYSFLMYRIYSKIVGAKVLFAKEINFKVSVNEILKKITKKTKIVFIANPNNPTGTYLTKREVLELRKRLNKKILLVIDDAYAEYMKNKDYSSGLELFKNKDNVFILRTFSKMFGLASLRVGWGYGSKKIVDALNVIKPPFNVNGIAQLAAIQSLKDKAFINKSIRHNLLYSKKIKKFLEKYNIFSNSVSANFLLLNFEKCRYSAKFLYEKLKKNGIILRSTEDGYHIKNKLRLTIGSKKENTKFMNVIKHVLKK
ncbi:histidinol-phosphate transaminase [Candidatus Pelagibacter communis]|uniref:histidinol-phosphate transaminase n=1 Tax=Pelagibacter ubique TaxID=198252 RepID=UPI00094D66FD|nr:histidinol-phosphate transaminase [Candidatus Pelagibacter ubique]